jgi:hypothetical protein
MNWRAALRDPLAHFLIAGALVFALFGDSSAPQDRRIVIDAAQVARLAGQFEQSFRRPPTAAELDAAVEEQIRDEVYYREALRLGLDRDDTVVRRRMRLKMEGLATAALDAEAPDDETLERWLASHPARFAGEPTFDFEQRFTDGTAVSLPTTMKNAAPSEIGGVFGNAFAAALATLPVGKWTEVRSSFGRHRVRVLARRPAPAPRLADMRQRVENDWRAEQARARSESAYRALREGYRVTIEGGR